MWLREPLEFRVSDYGPQGTVVHGGAAWSFVKENMYDIVNNASVVFLLCMHDKHSDRKPRIDSLRGMGRVIAAQGPFYF